MLKKTITFKGFDGREHTEDFYFNLTKEEVIKMEMYADGSQGMEAAFKKIVESKNTKEIYDTFTEIVLSSYGVRSQDGKRFIKNPEDAKAFTETNAFSELIFSFFQNPDNASDFMKGVLPDDIDSVGNAMAEQGNLTSEQIRARSEAQMQGHRQAQPQTIHEPAPVPVPQQQYQPSQPVQTPPQEFQQAPQQQYQQPMPLATQQYTDPAQGRTEQRQSIENQFVQDSQQGNRPFNQQ